MKGLSASRMTRIFHCPPSVLLPQVQTTSDFGDAGVVVHKFLDNYAKLGREAALELVPDDYRDICEQINLDAIRVGDWSLARTEVKYLYDPVMDTVTEMETGKEERPENSIPAFVDLQVVDGETVYIIDYKTGRGKQVPTHENWQLRLGAICALNKNPQCNRVVALLLYIDLDTGEPHESVPVVWDAFAIAFFASDLLTLVTETLPATDVKDLKSYAIGGWCKYCPAIQSCPVQMATVRELALMYEEGVPLVEMAQRTVPTEKLGAAYRKLQGIKSMVAVAESAFHSIANQTPIDLGNGEVLGPHESYGKRKIDGRAAFEWLSNAFDEKLAQESVTMEVTQKGVKAALKAHGEKQAPTLRAMLSDLEEVGKVKRPKSYRVEVYSTAALPESTSDDE